jgi:hypothetical protein
MLEYVAYHNGYYGATGAEMLAYMRELRTGFRCYHLRLGESRVSHLVEVRSADDLLAMDNLWFFPPRYHHLAQL